MKSDLERQFETIWRQLDGPDLISEYRFHPTRKWRIDYALPEISFGIEIEGGLWGQGRHNRAQGYTNDCEKYNAATAAGWRIYRITSLMFDDPDTYIKPIIDTIICPVHGKLFFKGDDMCEDCIPF